MNKTFILLLLLSMQITAFAQNSVRPEAGKPMPDFHLKDVRDFHKKTASLDDFKGKWFFMEFWFSGCKTAIKSLPVVDGYHRKFKDRMNFLLVGATGETFWGDGLAEVYEGLARKQNMNVPIAFDSTLALQWQIYAMPYVIIVDPHGIVRYLTSTTGMTEDKLERVIAGEGVTLYDKEEASHTFDINQLCHSIKPSDNTYLHHSILVKWDGQLASLPDISWWVNEGSHPGYQSSKATLFHLFNLAFTGMATWMSIDSLYFVVYPRPVLEVKDKSSFDFDFFEGAGLYNYYLHVPDSQNNSNNIMRMMQQDLERAFGYSASIERRSMPVWKLIAKPGAAEKLKTKSRQYYSDRSGSGGVAGFTLRNAPVSTLLVLVKRYIQTGLIPYFDETGIKTNIDITIDALLTDADQIKRELQKNGLDLVMGEKVMNVIVIRDPEEQAGLQQ